MHTIKIRRTYKVPAESPCYRGIRTYRVGWSVEMFTIPQIFLDLMGRHPDYRNGFRWSIWQAEPLPLNHNRGSGVNWLATPFYGLAGTKPMIEVVDGSDRYHFHLSFQSPPSAQLYGMTENNWRRLQQAVAEVESLTGKAPSDINRLFRAGWYRETLVPTLSER